MTNSLANLPLFLQSYIDFMQHIEGLYKDLNNTQKGAKFAELSKNILSTHEELLRLTAELNSKQSHDQGVDIFWLDPDTKKHKVYCQSKLHIRDKDDLDSIIGKFSSFEGKLNSSQINSKTKVYQRSLFDDVNTQLEDKIEVKYYISTLSNITKILKLYTDSGRPSVEFYKKLEKSKRIEIVDGEPLYKLFLEAYRKEYAIPQRVEFKSDTNLVNKNNVYMGIISANDLIKIYSDCGNGIFFENVRDFLGLDAKNSALDINNEIFKTAHDEPEKMLERNNGITFKASSFEYNDQTQTIVLENAGIINGCQTTMCIVEAKPSGDCFIPIKIVRADTENSSKIAKTANNQNKIEKINLELSEYLRPQLVKMSLAEFGTEIYSVDGSTTVPKIASSICYNRIFYLDLRYLFIGLFSDKPRNIFISDYAFIKFDELGGTYPSLDNKKYLVSILGNLIIMANQLFENLKKEYPSDSDTQAPDVKVGKVFNRFYTDQKGYKSYLISLAICCMLNISDEKRFKEQNIKTLISQVSEISENQKEEFQQSLRKIFKAVAISVIQHFSVKDKELDQEISQYLSRYLKSTEFSAFYLTYGIL